MEVSREWFISDKKVLNPSWVAREAKANGWPMLWHGLANSVTCPRGRKWGEAHFLVSQDTLDALTLSGPLDIKCVHENGTSTWRKYYCIRTQAASKDKEKPPHWITLADRRWLMERSAANKRYNLRTSAVVDGFIRSTTAPGAPWTWSEIVDDLWALLPAGVAGASPSFASPGSTPENLVFEGVSAWQAINQVLTAIGFVVCFDPLTEAFTIKNANTRSTQTLPTDRYLWRYRPEALPEVNYPASVVVTFPGIPGASDEPFMPAPETEEKSLGAGGIAGTQWPITDTMFSWDDNSTERSDRADEIKDAIKGLLYPLANPLGEVYSGIVEAITDSDITEIQWISDGSRGMTTTVKSVFQPFDWPKLPEFTGGGGRTIEYKITSAARESGGIYIGLMKATVVIHCGPSDLIGKTVYVYDHSDGLFDETDMTGYSGWAFWGQAWSLSDGDPCETLTPAHWIACNRVCAPNTGIYAEPCP